MSEGPSLSTCPKHVIEHHTLHGDFVLSNGDRSDTYIDLRSAVLCWRCAPTLVFWYDSEIGESGHVPVATGAFGALLLGSLAAAGRGGILWNPKGHGVEWSGIHRDGQKQVVLVDDVVTTGRTLSALRSACAMQGWDVVSEVVAVRRST